MLRGARWPTSSRTGSLARREAAAPQVKDDCVVGLSAFCAVDGAEVGLNAQFRGRDRPGAERLSVAAQGQNRQSAAGTASASASPSRCWLAALPSRSRSCSSRWVMSWRACTIPSFWFAAATRVIVAVVGDEGEYLRQALQPAGDRLAQQRVVEARDVSRDPRCRRSPVLPKLWNVRTATSPRAGAPPASERRSALASRSRTCFAASLLNARTKISPGFAP